MNHFGFRFRTCAVLASVVLLAGSGADAQWGTIKGQVKVVGTLPELPVFVKEGDPAAKDPSVCAAADIPDESLVVHPKSNGLANVVICLRQTPAKIHPDLTLSKKKEVTVKLKGCRFVPHVLLVRTDQRVRVINEDAAPHNTLRHGRTVVSGLISANDPEGLLIAVPRNERSPVKVTCDIHAWMEAYWIVLDHPYAAVTNGQGEFEIADLPEGEHEFSIWQEKVGYVEKAYKITVKPGVNMLEPIKIASDKFSETP